ncbi:LOB domain-containing protein 19-like [Chenopodium quinoa]|uniref:LOB domain-containing protein 19-like n=1 Tax=Chenopodium quinoa TaxID=63459 RepID=UPI000B79927A|nr:LOB domain-containing protein 19-like [Chenopodium quinoa]
MSNHHQQNNHQWHGGGGGGGCGDGNNSGGGPCGACKYLRRKCVKGCVFAPYFDSEQGTAHFAAVHKVFGASNASKLLLRIPAHRRLDAVVTLCYEALSRVRDPVYGCVAHIFTLQQQVLNMQAELAFVQARLSTLQRLPAAFPAVDQTPSHCCLDQISASSAIATTTSTSTAINSMPSFDNFALQSQPSLSSLAASAPVTAADLASFCNLTEYHQHDDLIFEDGDLQTLTREFVSKYLPGVKFKSEPH